MWLPITCALRVTDASTLVPQFCAILCIGGPSKRRVQGSSLDSGSVHQVVPFRDRIQYVPDVIGQTMEATPASDLRENLRDGA
jgi:hypothetical protein